MNKQEATQLLALIKLSYPNAYKDMDEVSKRATVNMWQSSFPEVPYSIMEQALGHYRMTNKFPPTVAEMVEELKHIHYVAFERALLCKGIGNNESMEQYRAIMAATRRYKDMDDFWGGLETLPLIGGNSDVQRLGTSRDNNGPEDRVSLLEAGERR